MIDLLESSTKEEILLPRYVVAENLIMPTLIFDSPRYWEVTIILLDLIK